jgi:hypothetical protein
VSAQPDDWSTRTAADTSPLAVVRPPRRTPILAKLLRLVLTVVRGVRWQAARTPILAIGGFGFLSAAAWSLSMPAGLAAVGVSLLVVEFLSGD